MGERLFEKHGTSKRRSWRKLHIGIDADSDEIVAFDLTDKKEGPVTKSADLEHIIVNSYPLQLVTGGRNARLWRIPLKNSAVQR